MKTTLKLLASLAFALVFFGEEARACSCATSEPCQAYWQASAVFAGVVTSVKTMPPLEREEARRREDAGEDVSARRVVRFVVERALRGVEGAQVEVRTGLGGGDCGFHFKTGERYLVYAHRSEKSATLYTSICTRTRPVAEAAEDLQYIAGLSASSSSGGSIYGTVQKQVRESRGAERDEVKYVPLAGGEIEITGGDKSIKVETDSEGHYRAEGLAPGNYTVRLKLPDTLLIYGPERKVEIEGSGCVGEWFTVETNGRLSGRVFDSEGRPAAKVALRLSSPEKKDKIYDGYTGAAITDDEGRYQFQGIPPGRYIIKMRFDGESPYGGRPFPSVYHPNVSDPDKAETVKIGEGERVEDFDLHLPPLPAARTIEGVVTYPDGAPAANVPVNYSSSASNDSHGSAKTDADGRFSFKAYEALSYRLVASVWSEEKKNWLASKVIEVPTGGAVEPLKIVLPRP